MLLPLYVFELVIQFRFVILKLSFALRGLYAYIYIFVFGDVYYQLLQKSWTAGRAKIAIAIFGCYKDRYLLIGPG